MDRRKEKQEVVSLTIAVPHKKVGTGEAVVVAVAVAGRVCGKRSKGIDLAEERQSS